MGQFRCVRGAWAIVLLLAAAPAGGRLNAQGLLPGGLASSGPSPAGKEIAEVVVQGNSRYSTEHILSQVRTRAGAVYKQSNLEEDSSKLQAKGWFQDVRVYTQPTSDGKVIVIFAVSELKSVVQSIKYQGAQHLSEKELEKLSGLRRGSPNNPAANAAAAQNIVRKYQEEGRVFASVNVLEGSRIDDVRVVFDIVEGPVVKIEHIGFEFVGPRSGLVSEGRLRTQLQSGTHFLRLGGEYNPMTLESDVVKLTEYYKGLGFLAARVSRYPQFSADQRNVSITFTIQEGPRYTIGKVQVDGNKAIEKDRILPLVDLKESDTFNKNVVQADIKRIKDYYGYGGRDVRVNEELIESSPGVVTVHYVLEEKEPVRVREVLIRGNEITRDNVIRRQVPLLPGQILSYPDILKAQENLKRLGIFDEQDPPTLTVLDSERGEGGFKDVLVTVKEKPTGKLMFGAGVNSDSGLTGSIVLNESNFDPFKLPTSFEDILEGRAFRGRGEEFRIQAQPGTTAQNYNVNFREPFLLDSPYSLGLGGYYFSRNYTEYDETRIGGRVNLGRRLDENWSVNATLRAENVKVGNIPFFAPEEVLEYQGNHAAFGLRGGVTYDTRDSYLRPAKGGILEVGYEQVFGSYTYGLTSAEYKRYFTTYERADGSGKHVLALRSQVGFAGSDTPIYDRFYAGGFTSMRGFQFRGVGPRVNDFAVGGDFLMLNSLEYQIPVAASDKLFFVAFVDSGTVEKDVSIRDYRVTAGAGMRISVPQLFGPVPIALDFAVPLNQAPGDKKQLFSFWLGFFN